MALLAYKTSLNLSPFPALGFQVYEFLTLKIRPGLGLPGRCLHGTTVAAYVIYIPLRSVLVSTTSEAASSFSTLSISSPDWAHPEKSTRRFTPVLTSSSFRTLPQPQLPSDPLTYRNEAVRVRHPFAPTGTASSDDEDYPSLPDNSNLATKKPRYSPSSSRVAFSTLTRARLAVASHASSQKSAGFPRDSESHAIRTLLGEVKSAVVRLHEDLSLVIQELGVIKSHLGNLSGSSPAASETPQDPQSPRGSPDPV